MKIKASSNTNLFRDVKGCLLLDKPSGMTSAQAVSVVKRCFHAKKAGHTGTLDPLATGMLVICFGKATKIAQFLLDSDKEYSVTCKLGVRTSTADACGEIIQKKNASMVTKELLVTALDKFMGQIEQTPPMFSSVKYNGTRLYKLARQGKSVKRNPRLINIKKLECNEFSENIFKLFVRCSKGTYIRQLVDDIGLSLSCGAHVTALHRLSVNNFKRNSMVKLETIKKLAKTAPAKLDQTLIPADLALSQLPHCIVSKSEARAINTGQLVRMNNFQETGHVKIYDSEMHFLGVGKLAGDGTLAPKQVFYQSNV
ncbi:MAG: tRNA pseudouridine(55) synthase TruB [Pseudomonadota bacterium]